MRQLDLAVRFLSLWLLASMVLDVLTPKGLTVYMIGATISPSIVILAVLYWKRTPRLDIAVVLSALWIATGIVLELISAKPLSLFALVIAITPLVVVGAAVNSRSSSSQISP